MNTKLIFRVTAGIAAAAIVAVLIIIFATRGGDGEYIDFTPVETRHHVFPETVYGVYVPTAYNLAFPSCADLSADELKAEIDGIVTKCVDDGINSIVFQVRPSCDALYKSDVFPVSEWLSTDGTLQLDCLEYLVEAAHGKNIAVTAWVNPLRVSVAKTDIDGLPDTSPAKGVYRDVVVSYGGKLYLNPAEPKARELVCLGIKEIVEGYEVDGILFDDYFYPYKVYEKDANGNDVVAVFDDADSFAALGGDFKSIDDFRRESVNRLIKEVYMTVKKCDEKCRFGVAVFGIWQNDNGSNGGSATRGLESYSELYCDTLAWIDGGYIDYVAPQIYWECDNGVAGFNALSDWWCSKIEGSGVGLYFSHAAYRYSDGDFSPGELTRQVEHARALGEYDGSFFYSYAAFRDDLAGINNEIKKLVSK